MNSNKSIIIPDGSLLLKLKYRPVYWTGESYSYQAEAVSSQYSDSDWSRQHVEVSLTGRYTDPHQHHTEQEAQCTLGDLDSVTRIITMRSDALEMMCFEVCLRFESQEKNMQSFYFVSYNNNRLFLIHYTFLRCPFLMFRHSF